MIDTAAKAGVDPDMLQQMRDRVRVTLPRGDTAAAQLLKHVFLKYDGDRDGKVTPEELRRGMAMMGADVTIDDVAYMASALATAEARRTGAKLPAAYGGGAVVDVKLLSDWIVDDANIAEGDHSQQPVPQPEDASVSAARRLAKGTHALQQTPRVSACK